MCRSRSTTAKTCATTPSYSADPTRTFAAIPGSSPSTSVSNRSATTHTVLRSAIATREPVLASTSCPTATFSSTTTPSRGAVRRNVLSPSGSTCSDASFCWASSTARSASAASRLIARYSLTGITPVSTSFCTRSRLARAAACTTVARVSSARSSASAGLTTATTGAPASTCCPSSTYTRCTRHSTGDPNRDARVSSKATRPGTGSDHRTSAFCTGSRRNTSHIGASGASETESVPTLIPGAGVGGCGGGRWYVRARAIHSPPTASAASTPDSRSTTRPHRRPLPTPAWSSLVPTAMLPAQDSPAARVAGRPAALPQRPRRPIPAASMKDLRTATRTGLGPPLSASTSLWQ